MRLLDAHSNPPLQVEEWMSQASGVPLEELRQYMFLYHDREATEHIMRVAGGLDSLVMGEGQILAQVLIHTPMTFPCNIGLHQPTSIAYTKTLLGLAADVDGQQMLMATSKGVPQPLQPVFRGSQGPSIPDICAILPTCR